MGKVSEDSPTTPICRCRVMYLGSAVPHITKDGLQGIQEPLRDLYPEQGLLSSGTSCGIDSWLSVWSNGILVENVDDQGNQVKRFHPIESLHYCAAVRFVSVPRGVHTNGNPSNSSAINGNSAANNTSTIGEKVAKFLPLDSPFSRYANTSHPPLFACILRRTTGIKVLECHAFICKKEAAANALVRCCFHAYADTIHAKQIDSESPYEQLDRRRSRSISALDTVEKVEEWRNRSNTDSSTHEEGINGTVPQTNGSVMNGHSMTNGHGSRPRTPSATSIISHSHDEENYKVWNGSAPLEREVIYLDGSATLRSMRSNANSMLSKPPKPRQIAIPCSAPPPPLPASLPPSLPPPSTLVKNKKSKKKESTLKKKHKYNGFLAPQQIPAPHILANGYALNMMSPPHHIHAQPPPHAIYGPIYSDGRRLMNSRRPVAPPPPPPLPPHMSHGYIPDGYPQPILIGPNEEPIYIPSMRPITPMSNYVQQALHSDQGFIIHNGQHYLPSEQMFGTSQRSIQREGIDQRDNRSKKKDRKKWSQQEIDSPFNTGIYKKKGHLNERAFSYSIRQEHRSRSNSLTNLQFEEQNGESVLSANGDSVPLMDDNYNTNHRSRNGSLTERELSERLTALKMNGDGPPPAPPPPPINGLSDQPKVATIKRRLNSKY